MVKIEAGKNFFNFFENHQVRLGVSLLPLFLERDRRGVNTWVCTSAA